MYNTTYTGTIEREYPVQKTKRTSVFQRSVYSVIDDVCLKRYLYPVSDTDMACAGNSCCKMISALIS